MVRWAVAAAGEIKVSDGNESDGSERERERERNRGTLRLAVSDTKRGREVCDVCLLTLI